MTAANAQEAFEHMGASVELGTTGLGINISLPVVTDHLIISAGYNFPSISINKSIDVGNGYVNQQIDKVKEAISLYNQAAPLLSLKPIEGSVERISKLDAEAKAKVNCGNFKLMLQYYPTTQSSFYISAGAFIGNGEMGSISGQISQDVWDIYKQAVAINNLLPKTPIEVGGKHIGYVKEIDEAVRFNIGERTFHIRPEDNGHIGAQLKVQKVKPYIGVGFGSSVPIKRRVGFQMEIGAYYQGKPTLESAQEVPYDIEAMWQDDLADIKDMVEKITWYPQLTFRITGRLF